MKASSKRYRCFISYAQSDGSLARRLHMKLESYRVPRGVVGKDERKLGRFFIDHDELAASSDLGPALRGALDDSEKLIVIASPAAARSIWVNEEVAYFGSRPQNRVLCVIASGVPNAHRADDECFPVALRRRSQSEGPGVTQGAGPLAADLTKEKFSRVFVRLVAGIIGVPFDTLWNRERRRRRKRLIFAGVGAISGSFIAFAGLAALQNQFDIRALTAQSVDVSREGWQNAWRPSYFEPSLRAAVAATALQDTLLSGLDAGACDLSKSIDTGVCALMLSGLSLKSTLIYGSVPATDQDNIRLDVESGDTFRRRMIMVDPYVRHIALSGDGRRMAFTTNKNVLLVFETRTRKLLLNYPSQSEIGAVALNGDGSACLLGSGNLLELDVSTGKVLSKTDRRFDNIDDIIADMGGWIVFANGHQLFALDAKLNEVWQRDTVKSEVYNLAPFAKLPRKYVVLESSLVHGSFEIVDLSGGQVKEIQNPTIGKGVGQVKALAISPDAQLIALGGNGSDGGNLAGGQVVSLKEGTEQARLVGHHGEIYAIRFLPNALGIITGASDFSIRFWDQTVGEERLRLIGHVAPIQDLALSPDGQTLVSASWDGTVRKWHIPDYWASDPARLRDDLCAPDAEFDRMPTIIPPGERKSLRAFLGRPWDMCDWRGLRSIEGWRQIVTVFAVRWAGISAFDYRLP